MDDTASFCIICGQKNSARKDPADSDFDGFESYSGTVIQKPVKPKRLRRVLIIASCIVLGLVLLCSSIVFAFQLLSKKDPDNGFSAVDRSEVLESDSDEEANDTTVEETSVETSAETTSETTEMVMAEIVFSENSLQLSVGSNTDLYSLLTTNLTSDKIVWTSDRTGEVNVDSTGKIQVLIAGASAIITAQSAAQPDVTASIAVTSLSLEAENFKEEVIALNNGSLAINEISIYSSLYSPAPRDKSFIWDRSIFYSLEDIDKSSITDGVINSYSIEKKQMTNVVSGNLIEYEIYRNPNTNLVNKITSIEHMPDTTLEIVDYYYTDTGKINFIFARNDTVYTPTYASPDKQGQRFYFTSDVMVKWRIVDTAQTLTDYAIGENEKQNTIIKENVQLYDSLSTDLQLQFDAQEYAMLNAAYNTYNVVINAKTNSSITGTVLDAAGIPIAASKISLLSNMYSVDLVETTTDQNGKYQFFVPSDVQTYQVNIQKDGYVTETLYQIEISEQIIDLYQENIRLAVNDGVSHSTQVLVTDALNVSDQTYSDGYNTNMERLSNAKVNFRAGINNRTGTIYSTVQTSTSGIALADLPSGNYTAEIISEGYASSYGTILANTDGTTVQISTTPVLSSDEIRIVLTWDEVPADLDSHLFTPYNEVDETTGYHIWYSNMSDASGNTLDVDDITSYGPETVTISNLSTGSYKYYVADFTNCSLGTTTSQEMSGSNAKVSVYTKTGLIATFYVPGNQPGVIWEVFEIRNMEIVPIQRYYTNIDDKPWWQVDKEEY